MTLPAPDRPATGAPHLGPEAAPVRGLLLRATRFELVKLLARGGVRGLLAACWLVPGLVVAVLSRQSSLPTDTAFGRWAGDTGWAGALLALGACSAGLLPLLVSVVVGDVFAAEDRLGTWGVLLGAVRSRRRLFAAKALAAVAVVLALVTGLAASSTAGGLLSRGAGRLVGLDGHLVGTGAAARLVLLAWLVVLAPTLAFAAVGLLGSVLLGRSPVGLLVPALLALLLQVVQLLPLPLALRVALPGSAYVAWRGLSTSPAQVRPVLVGVAVALLWALVATLAARAVFLRRDVGDASSDGVGPLTAGRALLPLAALLAGTTAVAALALPDGPRLAGPQLERVVATSFGHLYRLQSRELRRPDVSEARLGTTADCDRGGRAVPDAGPGGDWRCVVTWHVPGAATTTVTGSAAYQVELAPDGRFVADGDGPQPVNGPFRVPRAHGPGPNPLWQFDGSLDPLAAPLAH